MLTLRGLKQRHKSSSAGDTAAARAAPGHSLAGHVLGAGHAAAAPFPGKWPRSSPPAQLECEMGNQRHNSSVFIPAPCKSKQRTEPESKRIHQVFLSGPQGAPVATQWLGHSEVVFCGLSLLSKRDYGHLFLTSFPPAHPFLPQKGAGALCSWGSGWEPSALPGAEGALQSPQRGLAGLK